MADIFKKIYKSLADDEKSRDTHYKRDDVLVGAILEKTMRRI